MEKVYCRDCKYYYYPNVDGSSIYSYCRKTENVKDTPIRPVTTIMTCEEAKYNEKNQCKFYEKRKWLEALWSLLRWA